MVGLILIVGHTRRHQADQLAAQHDLELIAGLQAEPDGLGLAHHQLAVELDLGGIAEAAAWLPLAATAAGAKVHTFCFQQHPTKGGEVQPLHAVLFGADIAGGTNKIGFRDICGSSGCKAVWPSERRTRLFSAAAGEFAQFGAVGENHTPGAWLHGGGTQEQRQAQR